MYFQSLFLVCFVTCGIGQDIVRLNKQLYVGSACQTPAGRPGTCIQLKKCAHVVEKLKARTPGFNRGLVGRCSFEKLEEVICCDDSDEHAHQLSTKAEVITEAPPRKSRIACEKFTADSPRQLDFHIIEGVPTLPGEFPHMVAIAHPESIGGVSFQYDCGASLISEEYALTAAHCVNRPELKPLFVTLGKVSLKTDDDQLEPVNVGVSNIFIHPKYSPNFIYHDIAILRFNQSVTFTPFIRPVCLDDGSRPIDQSTTLTATGWGKTDFQSRQTSNILLKVNLTFVDVDRCNETYFEAAGSDRRINRGVMKSGQMCAFGPTGGDACQGDSGGPLQIVLDDERIIQVGIISTGIVCGFLPGIYTKVADYLDWIESVVWPA